MTDPDLVSHLGKLLQTYREVSPEKREGALLRAMREIKDEAIRAREARAGAEGAERYDGDPTDGEPTEDKHPEAEGAALQARAGQARALQAEDALPVPEPVSVTPPFEPDLFTGLAASDRRRYVRIKCYVAVEIHVEGVHEPVWGNLSNVSRGGCLVETASAVPPGKALEIGLWVSSGKLWVKGVILSGVATRSAPSHGVRVKFSESELSEKEHLREFLKFVENTTRKSQSGNAYVAQLKA